MLTLDTSVVIHGAQGQDHAALVDRLVEHARQGRVGLSLTTAYLRDQETARPANTETNHKWLESAPVLGMVPGPFRLDYSRLDGPDVLVSDDLAELDSVVREIVLPRRLGTGGMSGDASLSDRDVRRFIDVQHLLAHRMAGHDAFVTTDFDDLVGRRDRLLTEAGITIWTLIEAVDKAEA